MFGPQHQVGGINTYIIIGVLFLFVCFLFPTGRMLPSFQSVINLAFWHLDGLCSLVFWKSMHLAVDKSRKKRCPAHLLYLQKIYFKKIKLKYPRVSLTVSFTTWLSCQLCCSPPIIARLMQKSRCEQFNLSSNYQCLAVKIGLGDHKP